MMRNIVFILITSILLVSCSREKKHETGENQLEAIKISALDKSNSIKSILDILYLEKVVELNTADSNLIGSATRVRIASDNIFVYDHLRGTVYRFDKDGNVINTVGKKGRGPGEFVRASDFCINDTNKEIIVLDNSRKIVKYKFSGEFVKSIKVPVFAMKVAFLEGDRYILDGSGYDNKGKFKSFIIIDNEGRIVDEQISFLPMYAEKSFLIESGIQGSSNDYAMCFPFNDTIYRYSDNSLSPKYIFDFENQKLPEEVFKNCKDNEEVWKKAETLDKVLYVHNFLETDELFYAVCWIGGKTLSTLIYTKNNQKTYYYNGNNISDLLRGYFISATDKNELIFVFEPYRAATDDFKSRMRFMDIRYADNELYQKLRAACLKAAKLDNPSLLYFKLKKELE